MANPRRIVRNSLPISQPLLRSLGLIVPADAGLSGSFRSRQGVRIDADKVKVAPDTNVVVHGNVAYLMPMGGSDIKGKVTCQCVEGEGGSCGIISTETTDNPPDPALGCASEGCQRCLMTVVVEPNKLASLTLAALGVEHEATATIIGDLRRDALLTSGSLRIRDDAPMHFEEGEGVAYMVAQNGTTMGEFKCHCSSDTGGCELVASTKVLVCQKGTCAKACTLKLTIPAPKLSFAAFG